MAALFVQQGRTKKRWTLSAVIGVLAFAASLCVSPVPAEAVALDVSLNERVVMVPTASGTGTVELETTIFTPPGSGPFPVVVMNHGKALGDPRSQGRDRFIVLSREFVRHGYAVVIPMRKGFSKSGGKYVEYGCDMVAHGQAQADDLQGTLEYLRTQSWADSERVLVAGQSYGGLTALAFGERQFPGVKGLINFAGGLKVHGGGCSWQQALVDTFAGYGARTSLPSLWFYGENDHHFGPQLAARLYDAYVQAGGLARLIAFGPFKKDAHGMSASRDGVKIWWPETERFLKDLGLPTDTVVAFDDEFTVPEVAYAAIDDVEALPYLRGKAREQYRTFLGKSLPRAFAVSPSGAWGWAEEGDDPVMQALAGCQKNSSQPCRLYAVNDVVVWSGEPPAAMMAAAPSPAANAPDTPAAAAVVAGP
ncbi:MAG TPA: CocE/NonD family hydrolase [Noviherbaspirillum sp.]|nr:CocE/NonD family hydrolase [Noviherbaspirillum sp.]